MRSLIDDLLQYSRIETKAKPFAPVSMNKVLERVLKILKVPIQENGADLVIEPLPTIMADESQMVQVFQNLISNAIKFRGEDSPKIHVFASQANRDWTFAVQDNGIGMNVAYSDKIFQMFQRLHSAHEYPGTGVGLAIVKKIVERHGGRVWVESEEGKGATFYFTVPKVTITIS